MRISDWSSDVCSSDLAQLAHALTAMDDRGLLIAFCGSCPSGLRGALKRTGQRPEEPLFYDELFSIFANSAHKSLMHALRHAKRIDAKVVQTARIDRKSTRLNSSH